MTTILENVGLRVELDRTSGGLAAITNRLAGGNSADFASRVNAGVPA